jgi:plasmid stability protein
MKRTLVQFDEETYRQLRHRAFSQERSVSALVREFVAQGLAGQAQRTRPILAAKFHSVRAGRSKQGRPSAVSEDHDEALAEAIDK